MGKRGGRPSDDNGAKLRQAGCHGDAYQGLVRNQRGRISVLQHPCQPMSRRPRADHYRHGPAHHHGPEADGRRDRVRAEYDHSVTGLHAGRAERVGYSSRVVSELAVGQSRSTGANRLDTRRTERRLSQEVMKHPTRRSSSCSPRTQRETLRGLDSGPVRHDRLCGTISPHHGFVKVPLEPGYRWRSRLSFRPGKASLLARFRDRGDASDVPRGIEGLDSHVAAPGDLDRRLESGAARRGRGFERAPTRAS